MWVWRAILGGGAYFGLLNDGAPDKTSGVSKSWKSQNPLNGWAPKTKIFFGPSLRGGPNSELLGQRVIVRRSSKNRKYSIGKIM